MLPQAEVYVYEDDKMIQGFIGIQSESMDEFTGEKEYVMNWESFGI